MSHGYLHTMLDMLTGAYNRDDVRNAYSSLPLETNIGRLFNTLAWGLELVHDQSDKILLWDDLDNAQGAVLDRYGENFGVARDGAPDAFYRLLTQARDEMCHDYVTGVYNRTHLDSAFRGHVSAAARDGEKVSAALVRVNEYAALCRSESVAAADRCLNTAAGVLSLALDGMGTETTLIRLEDGVFLVVAVGVSARELENCLQEALRNARRNFGITLARRGEFTATVASADWVETGSWDLMVSLAESRLYNP